MRVGPAGVRAGVECRVAVLWVRSARRAADRHGVLLPVTAKGDGLVALTGPVAPPKGRPGQSWGDAAVEAAAQVAGVLFAHREAINPGQLTAEVKEGVVTLRRGRQRIVWGQQGAGEPGDEAKAARLAEAVRSGADADLRQ